MMTDQDKSTTVITRKILLAEDTEEIQMLIAHIISKVDIIVDIAFDGQQAIEKALQDAYDLILMDMTMPNIDGMQATQTLRQLGIKIPIIALTARTKGSVWDEFKSVGGTAFIAKPIEANSLLSTLAEYLPSVDAGQSFNLPNPENNPELKYLFEIKLKQMLDEIDQAKKVWDWGKMASTIHKIKGSAGSFGHPELSGLAMNIESQIYTKDKQSISYAINALHDWCRPIVNHK